MCVIRDDTAETNSWEICPQCQSMDRVACLFYPRNGKLPGADETIRKAINLSN